MGVKPQAKTLYRTKYETASQIETRLCSKFPDTSVKSRRVFQSKLMTRTTNIRVLMKKKIECISIYFNINSLMNL